MGEVVWGGRLPLATPSPLRYGAPHPCTPTPSSSRQESFHLATTEADRHAGFLASWLPGVRTGTWCIAYPSGLPWCMRGFHVCGIGVVPLCLGECPGSPPATPCEWLHVGCHPAPGPATSLPPCKPLDCMAPCLPAVMGGVHLPPAHTAAPTRTPRPPSPHPAPPPAVPRPLPASPAPPQCAGHCQAGKVWFRGCWGGCPRGRTWRRRWGSRCVGRAMEEVGGRSLGLGGWMMLGGVGSLKLRMHTCSNTNLCAVTHTLPPPPQPATPADPHAPMQPP